MRGTSLRGHLRWWLETWRKAPPCQGVAEVVAWGWDSEWREKWNARKQVKNLFLDFKDYHSQKNKKQKDFIDNSILRTSTPLFWKRGQFPHMPLVCSFQMFCQQKTENENFTNVTLVFALLVFFFQCLKLLDKAHMLMKIWYLWGKMRATSFYLVQGQDFLIVERVEASGSSVWHSGSFSLLLL